MANLNQRFTRRQAAARIRVSVHAFSMTVWVPSKRIVRPSKVALGIIFIAELSTNDIHGRIPCFSLLVHFVGFGMVLRRLRAFALQYATSMYLIRA